MRFFLMVTIAVATGAGSMTALQTLVPGHASMREAVEALGGAWSGFACRLQSADCLPESGGGDQQAQQPGVSLFPHACRPLDPGDGPLFKPYQYKPDPAIQRAIAAGIGARVSQDIRRAQDITAYARNPRAWHGVPPH